MRDRSRIHLPAVAHPVAHPSDLGFYFAAPAGEKPLKVPAGIGSELRGPLWGTSVRATHP